MHQADREGALSLERLLAPVARAAAKVGHPKPLGRLMHISLYALVKLSETSCYN
jgi:hypothetical protein